MKQYINIFTENEDIKNIDFNKILENITMTINGLRLKRNILNQNNIYNKLSNNIIGCNMDAYNEEKKKENVSYKALYFLSSSPYRNRVGQEGV